MYALYHLLKELHEQTWAKDMHFNEVDDFNYILENFRKLRWQFLAGQHVSVDGTVGRLTFRSNLFDLSSIIRKTSIHGSRSICAYTNTKRPIQFSFCEENALVIANTLFQQHKRRLYTWTSLDGQYWNRIDYILCSLRWRSSIQSTKRRRGADCGSDHEFLIAKVRLKLKKVGKTTRPFRYDLIQILYDYTVEVRKDLRD